MDYKLGLLPPKGAPSIKFSAIWTGKIPDHPAKADHFAKVNDWGLYENDKFGVCGPTSVANQVKLETAYQSDAEISPTQDDVFDLYRRSGNPNFDPATGADDNGVDMQTMLEAVNKGGIGGRKCLAFAQVDVRKPEELRAAEATFGSLLLGVDLQQAQKTQTDRGIWDYSPSDEWGGHAVLSGLYDPTKISVVTWELIVAINGFWPFTKASL
jgi:hypothetical protein